MAPVSTSEANPKPGKEAERRWSRGEPNEAYRRIKLRSSHQFMTRAESGRLFLQKLRALAAQLAAVVCLKAESDVNPTHQWLTFHTGLMVQLPAQQATLII